MDSELEKEPGATKESGWTVNWRKSRVHQRRAGGRGTGERAGCNKGERVDGELEKEQGAIKESGWTVNWRKSRVQQRESGWTVNWRKSRVQ